MTDRRPPRASEGEASTRFDPRLAARARESQRTRWIRARSGELCGSWAVPFFPSLVDNPIWRSSQARHDDFSDASGLLGQARDAPRQSAPLPSAVGGQDPDGGQVELADEARRQQIVPERAAAEDQDVLAASSRAELEALGVDGRRELLRGL